MAPPTLLESDYLSFALSTRLAIRRDNCRKRMSRTVMQLCWLLLFFLATPAAKVIRSTTQDYPSDEYCTPYEAACAFLTYNINGGMLTYTWWDILFYSMNSSLQPKLGFKSNDCYKWSIRCSWIIRLLRLSIQLFWHQKVFESLYPQTRTWKKKGFQIEFANQTW